MSNDLYNIDKVINYQISRVGRKAPIDREDLYQIGYLGYLKAKKNFKIEFGGMTLNYAVPYIRDELLTAIKKEKRHRQHHLNMSSSTEDVDNYIENYPQPNVGQDLDLDKIESIKQAIKSLPETERYILTCMYFDRQVMQPKDIAELRGIERKTLYSVKSKAMNKIRDVVLRNNLEDE